MLMVLKGHQQIPCLLSFASTHYNLVVVISVVCSDQFQNCWCVGSGYGYSSFLVWMLYPGFEALFLDKPEPGCMASLNLKMTLCVVILCSIFLKAVTNCMNLLKHVLLMSNVMSKWITCVKQSSTMWACSNCSAVD